MSPFNIVTLTSALSVYYKMCRRRLMIRMCVYFYNKYLHSLFIYIHVIDMLYVQLVFKNLKNNWTKLLFLLALTSGNVLIVILRCLDSFGLVFFLSSNSKRSFNANVIFPLVVLIYTQPSDVNFRRI